jgi:hypothetical protein
MNAAKHLIHRFGTTSVLLRFCTAAIVFTVLPGCGSDGPDLVGVGGTVKLDGTPLPGAEVRFLPIVEGNEPARPASAMTDETGHYSLEYTTERSGARPGKYRVYISTMQRAMPDVPAVPEKIPEVYNEKTTLKVEITDEQRAFDFDLKSDAGKIVQPRR